MLAYCSHCVYNLFIRAGNRGRWPASVKLVTLPYLTLPIAATSCVAFVVFRNVDNHRLHQDSSKILQAAWCK